MREPINVAAARTFGLLSSIGGSVGTTRAIMHYSESLSRRDVPTQLWLIEDRVAQNDIPGALQHYDRAMRVSEDARAILLPVLIEASTTPAIRVRVGDMIAQRPPWWFAFAVRLTGDSTSAGTMAYLLGRLRLDPSDERERNLIARAIQRFIELNGFGHARALYRAAKGGAAPATGVIVNGDFESSDFALPPFDWHLVSDGGFGAFREPREGAEGNAALTLSTASGRTGEVARQLVILRPGRYRLTGLVGEAGGDALSRPQVAIICAVRHGADLLRMTVPPASRTPSRFQANFLVPAEGCAGQWLSIVARADLGGDGAASPWLDSLTVRREE